MDFILSPPHGVSPIVIGMEYEEALQAVSEWGVPEISGPRTRRPSVRFILSRGTMDIIVHLEKGDRVSAIEFWRFEGDEPDLRVLLDGVDVFRSLADDILQGYRSHGYQVDDSDLENPTVPGVTLGFTRETAQDVPRDSSGLPLHFTSVLVAPADYYE